MRQTKGCQVFLSRFSQKSLKKNTKFIKLENEMKYICGQNCFVVLDLVFSAQCDRFLLALLPKCKMCELSTRVMSPIRGQFRPDPGALLAPKYEFIYKFFVSN